MSETVKNVLEKLREAGIPLKESKVKPLYDFSISVGRGILEIDDQNSEYDTENIPRKYLVKIEEVMKENRFTRKGIRIGAE